MIVFDREGSKIVAKVCLPIPGTGNWTYTFHHEDYSIPAAQLAVNQMDETLHEKLKQIREDAYNQGWKDAKAHKGKETWFTGLW